MRAAVLFSLVLICIIATLVSGTECSLSSTLETCIGVWSEQIMRGEKASMDAMDYFSRQMDEIREQSRLAQERAAKIMEKIERAVEISEEFVRAAKNAEKIESASDPKNL